VRQWRGKTALKTARGCIAASPNVKSDAFEELPLLLGFLFCWHSILLSSFKLSANNDWRSALSFQCIVSVESIVKQKVIAMNENFAQRVRFVATITLIHHVQIRRGHPSDLRHSCNHRAQRERALLVRSRLR
jgi:hypothetical protein